MLSSLPDEILYLWCVWHL